MTIEDMHIGVKLRVQKLDSGAYDDILDEEVDYYLNQSIIEYVKQQVNVFNAESSLVQNDVVLDNLSSLLVESNGIATVTNTATATQATFALPADYYFYVFSSITIDGSKRVNEYIAPRLLKRYLEQQNNSPLYRKIPIYTIGSTLKVLADSQINYSTSNPASTLDLTYIKKPAKVDVTAVNPADCDLPEHTHEEIVNLAVSKIINDITPRQ